MFNKFLDEFFIIQHYKTQHLNINIATFFYWLLKLKEAMTDEHETFKCILIKK